MRHRFQLPASTSNLGAGFDAVGLALNRYLKVTVEPADDYIIEVHGACTESIPIGKDNLLLRAAGTVAERRARKLPPFRLEIENEIPLARGLGSSAAAIIAGITCYELMTDDILRTDDV